MASLQLAPICATILMMSTTVAIKPHEPACSQYHFQEMVLEKLIRIEHKVQLMDVRIVNQVELMDEKLKQFETRIENGIGDVKQQQEALDNTKSSIIEKTEEVLSEVEANVSQTIGNVQRQIKRMSGDIFEDRKNITDAFQKFMDNTTTAMRQIAGDLAITPAVSFFARDIADVTPSRVSMIRFTVPAVNDGDGYDASTGYFTAPYDGTYLFTVQICTYVNKYIDVQIMAAGSAVAGLRQYDNTYNAVCTSGNAMAVLKTGDQAWVKCASRSSSGTVIYQSSSTRYTNSFSGVLLHKNVP